MRDSLIKGSTDVESRLVRIQQTDGSDWTGSLPGDFALKYRRSDQSTATTITTVSGTVGTPASSSWVVDPDDAAVYELGLPTAVKTSGDWVRVFWTGTGVKSDSMLFDLIDFNRKSSTTDVGKVAGSAVSGVSDFHADTSALATLTNQTTIAGYLDTEIAAILSGVTSLQTGVTVTSMAANVLTASALATDAVTEIQSGLSTFDASTDTVDVGEVAGSAVSGVDDFKADVSALATATELTKAVDRSGYCLTILAGTISTAGTATETFDLTIDSVAHRVVVSGLDTDGNRSGQALSKP